MNTLEQHWPLFVAGLLWLVAALVAAWLWSRSRQQQRDLPEPDEHSDRWGI